MARGRGKARTPRPAPGCLEPLPKLQPLAQVLARSTITGTGRQIVLQTGECCCA